VTRSALVQRLSALERGLEELLTCFESEVFPAQGALDSTFGHVLRAFEDVRAELGGRGVVSGEQRERAEHCQQLYAVATAVLARRREELAAERDACGVARRHLQRLTSAESNGGSCDVSA
jgi:hypothetical protein